MRQALLACVAVVLFALAGSAMSISGEWSTSLVLGPEESFSSTELALSATLTSWEFTSTSVLTLDGLDSQAVGFKRELGPLAISGGLAFSVPPGAETTFVDVGEGPRWTASGLELTTWDVSFELSLDRLTIGLTIIQRPTHEK
ncbi:MAG: hypothetical protein R6U88_04545 [Candidatus Bipolaricaulota bacterium]